VCGTGVSLANSDAHRLTLRAASYRASVAGALVCVITGCAENIKVRIAPGSTTDSLVFVAEKERFDFGPSLM